MLYTGIECMHVRMEYWTLISKNSAKLKRDYYFQAEFLEEIWYILYYTVNMESFFYYIYIVWSVVTKECVYLKVTIFSGY